MKKVLWVVLAIFLIIVIGLVVFVVTFDLNRYKPMIVSKLEAAIGNSVRIDHLSLGWNGGLSLVLNRFDVYPDAKAGGEPAISIDRVSAILELAPLLKREISIGSVVINHPHLHLVRSGSSAYVAGLGSSTGKTTPASSGAAFAAVPVLVKAVRFEDGEIRLTDTTSSPPSEIEIRKLDASFDHASMDKPIRVDARMAVLGGQQNVFVTGRVYLPLGTNRTGTLENVRLKVDLGGFDSGELARAIPGLGRIGFGGETVVDLDRLTFDSGGVHELAGVVQLSQGKIIIPELQNAVERIGVSGSFQKDRLEIKRLSADFAGGKAEASGSIDQLLGPAVSNLQGTLAGFSLESFQPEAPKDAPRIQGKLSGSFRISSAGLNTPQISRSLAGEVEAQINEPVIVNFNLVREVFARLSLLPRLVETLEKRLPENYGEKLKRRDTVLNPIHLQGKIGNGQLVFDNVLLVSDTFVLNGRMVIALDGSFSGTAVLRLDPDLSAALIRSVTELQYLTDAEGRLEIPVQVQSDGRRLAIAPDLQYVAAKLAVVKTQEVLGKWLEKKVGGKSGTSGDEPNQQPAPQGDLVSSLIGGLLKEKT